MTTLDLPRERHVRGPRVPFQTAIRVTPESGDKAFRVLSVDLSEGGIFLQMPMPFATGTRLFLALEADGKVLPFAKGEVAWRRTLPLPEAVKPGAAVRFTSFDSPRANQLVRHLVDALHRGEKPRPYGKAVRLNRWIVAVLASVLFGVCLGSWYVDHRAPVPVAVTAAAEPVIAEADDSTCDEIESSELADADVPTVPEIPGVADALGAPERWLELRAPAAVAQVRVSPLRHRVIAWRPKLSPPPAPQPLVRHPLQPVPPVSAIAIGATRALDSRHPTEARAAPAPTRAEPDGKPQAIAIPGGALKTINLVRAGHGFRFDFELQPHAAIAHLTTLKDPSRLAIDLTGAGPKKPLVVAGLDGIQRVRVARFGTGTRVVLDLTMPVQIVEHSGTHVVVAP